MSTTPDQDTPVFAVLTAAGSGSRLGHTLPKALVPLGGVPMFCHATAGLIAAGVNGIVITAPTDECDHFRHIINANAERFTTPQGHTIPISVVPGGESRQASVANGLRHLPHLAAENGLTLTDTTVILIHDAARALTPASATRRVITAVTSGHNAVIPALPVADTLKNIDRTQSTHTTIGTVNGTADRTTLVAVQTPQGFTWELISRAHTAAAHLAGSEDLAATDDAGLVERMGLAVHIVDGHAHALKVTTPWDLSIAEWLLNSANHTQN